MKQGSFQVYAGKLEKEFTAALRRGTRANLLPNIMAGKAGVFTRNVTLKRLIANRLGWTKVASKMKRQLPAIEKFGQEVFKARIAHVVLMGMGGSSLCPELFKLMFRRHPRLKSFDVIDSTDPDAVNAVARRIDLKRSLFIVASKSGGTVETRSQEAHFIQRLQAAGIRDFGRHFVAITDKGSALERFGRKHKYRKVFLNPPDIGGRYSALSYFGLVPGFFAGVDLRALINDAVMMEKLLSARLDETNPALVLASFMAAGAKTGRDKLTFLASRQTAPLVPWVEQLLAESTGKKGKGVVPIEAEPVGRDNDYGKDRLFVTFKVVGESDPIKAQLKRKLLARKCPLLEMSLGSKNELGRQFLLWEAATAATGYFLGVNPFDEPNVTESKNNTNEILAGYERIGTLPEEEAIARWGKLSLIAVECPRPYTRAHLSDFRQLLRRFFTGVRPPKYFAILNYFKSDRRTETALAKIRSTVRSKTGIATIRGYGPRYLHSIGQLYKGGPQDGLFIVFVRGRYGRANIPGRPFNFGQLIRAQASGDARALASRKLPLLVIEIESKPAEGLEYFSRVIKSALA